MKLLRSKISAPKITEEMACEILKNIFVNTARITLLYRPSLEHVFLGRMFFTFANYDDSLILVLSIPLNKSHQKTKARLYISHRRQKVFNKKGSIFELATQLSDYRIAKGIVT